jgi:S1-C subfamily serine protease
MFGCEFETSNNVIPVPGGAPPQPPDGLTIISVYYESAAQRAGFKNNDVITSFNGAEVTILYDLKRELTLLRPGATVPVTVKRDGKTITLRTRLGDSIGIKPEPEAIVIVEP